MKKVMTGILTAVVVALILGGLGSLVGANNENVAAFQGFLKLAGTAAVVILALVAMAFSSN